LISDLMAMVVVERLEVVEIGEDERQRGIRFVRVRDRPSQRFVESLAIGDAG